MSPVRVFENGGFIMKKIISVLLAVLTVCALFASCGKKGEGEKKSADTKEVTYKEEDIKVFEGFNYVVDEEGNAAIVGYTAHDYEKKLTIPDTLGNAKVTVIAANAFENCEKLEEVRFPSYLTSIESGAFKGSSIYGAIMVYSRGLKSIGDEAFKDCPKLVQIDIPETVEEFGKNCFAGCEHLMVVTFRGNNINLDMSAFEGSYDKFTLWTYEKNSAVTEFGKANNIEVKYLP